VRPPVRVPISGLRQGPWELPEAAGRYVARVLRRGNGDTLLLFDGASMAECEALIVAVDGSRVTVDARPPRPAALAPPRQLTLVQSVGKADKLDQIVRDATELGATRVVPLVTRRTVVQLAPGPRADARVARWRKIASEAARQSGRGDTPEIAGITELAGASSLDADVRLVLVPGAAQPAGPLLLACPPGASLALLVGPEGGLDPAEIALLVRSGWIEASLGPRGRRTPTVAAALLGALLLLAVAGPPPEG
jgi:16S rRNA (uracil1498-N3)-methyltransferase